jgi:O-acetyl-ADP-ribose deacetylase (regulator of RNase III)
VISEDFLHIDRLSREEQEKRLRELDQRGQTIAAVHIAAGIYGYDLNQAKAFVEGLRPKP